MAVANLIVLSGAPGAGKTTTLHEIARLGFACAPEVAREIIREQVNSGGQALPWGDREAYTELMLLRSIESYLEHAKASAPIFFDRGIPDTLGYARLIGIQNDGPIRDACLQYRYAPTVFVAPAWREIYQTDSERKQDFAEAEKTFTVICETYRDCGYEVVVLPKTSPAERAKFILGELALAS
jgi:predicted ATPase